MNRYLTRDVDGVLKLWECNAPPKPSHGLFGWVAVAYKREIVDPRIATMLTDTLPEPGQCVKLEGGFTSVPVGPVTVEQVWVRQCSGAVLNSSHDKDDVLGCAIPSKPGRYVVSVTAEYKGVAP